MFNLFKPKPKGKLIEFHIKGMHCTSCSISIDGELEDLEGVYKVDTSYAKAVTKVEYDDAKVKKGQLKEIISNLGYKVSETKSNSV